MASTLQNLRILKKQSGAVLIVGLIFLVVLTMLGITAMQVGAMEERMAGNSRDRSLAFQASEAGLRDGAKFLIGKDFYAFDDKCTDGLCAQGSAPDWTTYGWDGTKDVAATTEIDGLAEEPRYYSEYAGEIKCPECTGGWKSAYRLTVRGKGGNTNTTVLLEQVQRP